MTNEESEIRDPEQVTESDLREIVTVTPSTIKDILTKRFGAGSPGSGLSMSCHEAHMLMAKLHGSTQAPANVEEQKERLLLVISALDATRENHAKIAERIDTLVDAVRSEAGITALRQSVEEGSGSARAPRGSGEPSPVQGNQLPRADGRLLKRICKCGHAEYHHILACWYLVGDERACSCEGYDPVSSVPEPPQRQSAEEEKGQGVVASPKPLDHYFTPDPTKRFCVICGDNPLGSVWGVHRFQIQPHDPDFKPEIASVPEPPQRSEPPPQ